MKIINGDIVASSKNGMYYLYISSDGDYANLNLINSSEETFELKEDLIFIARPIN